ncbi:MAG: hypothetical protein ACI8ZN_002488 [Bacteroidia bacterium]|jgi:hypothetical protein
MESKVALSRLGLFLTQKLKQAWFLVTKKARHFVPSF